MSIDDETKKRFDFEQACNLMLHEDLIKRLQRANNLLERTKFVLEQEQYLSLPVEIGNFLKEV